MSPNFKQALLHGLKVAAHIIFAAIVVGLGVLLNNNSQVTQQFTTFLLQFGLPAMIVNVIVASVVKFIQAKASQINATIETE